MGDSTKPSAGGEGGNLFHLPRVKQIADNGTQEVVPQAPGSHEKNVEVSAEVVAVISGMQDETAQAVDSKVGELVKIDFKRGRKKGLASSHAHPKSKRKTGLSIVKTGHKPPRPKQIEGLGVYAKVETPEYDVISGGRRKKTNKAVIDKDREYAERTGRIKLMRVVNIMKDELEAMDHKELTGPEVTLAARELLGLGVQEFAREKRETDVTFFQEVAKILLKLWPRNYQLFLDDRRIQDMMSVIRNGGPHRVILTTMAGWHQHRLY